MLKIMVARRGVVYHPDLYTWGSPGEYGPSLNAPAVQEAKSTEIKAETSDGRLFESEAGPRLPDDSGNRNVRIS